MDEAPVALMGQSVPDEGREVNDIRVAVDRLMFVFKGSHIHSKEDVGISLNIF